MTHPLPVSINGKLSIDGKRIHPDAPAWIIAELGVNHDGSLDRALELVGAAAAAGCDAVKVQCFRADSLVSRGVPRSAYQQKTTRFPSDQRDLLRSLELPPEALTRLSAEARRLGLTFFGSPFDLESLTQLLEAGVSVVKIASGEVTDLPLLRRAAASGLPLILSTGMANFEEIDRTVLEVRQHGAVDLVLLHCVTSYPTPVDQANVRAVQTIAQRTGCLTGYSDHCLFHEASFAARALGACVLERHLTYDRDASGPDHATSLDPEGFCDWVEGIRRLERALGDGAKIHTETESEGRRLARKSIVTKHAISRGSILREEMLTTRRAPDGVRAEEWDRVVGSAVRVDLQEGEELREEHLA